MLSTAGSTTSSCPTSTPPTAEAPTETADAPRTENVDLSNKAGLFFSQSTEQPLRLVVNEGTCVSPAGLLVPMAETVSAIRAANWISCRGMSSSYTSYQRTSSN